MAERGRPSSPVAKPSWSVARPQSPSRPLGRRPESPVRSSISTTGYTPVRKPDLPKLALDKTRPASPSGRRLPSPHRPSSPSRQVEAKCVGQITVTVGFGIISLPNYNLTSFEGLGCYQDLTALYMQNNYLDGFLFLETQPRLREMVLDNNRITSFRGALVQPKLEIISLRGNPVTHHPRYRVMCLLAFGEKLRKIDGEVVREVERDEARLFGPMAARAVRAGWLVDENSRSEEEFSQLAHVYESKAQVAAQEKTIIGYTVPQSTGSRSRGMGDYGTTSSSNSSMSNIHSYQPVSVSRDLSLSSLSSPHQERTSVSGHYAQQIAAAKQERLQQQQQISESRPGDLTMNDLSGRSAQPQVAVQGEAVTAELARLRDALAKTEQNLKTKEALLAQRDDTILHLQNMLEAERRKQVLIQDDVRAGGVASVEAARLREQLTNAETALKSKEEEMRKMKLEELEWLEMSNVNLKIEREARLAAHSELEKLKALFAAGQGNQQ